MTMHALLLTGLASLAIGAQADKLIPELEPYHGVSRSDVDATTIKGKVLCGYQGWFRSPGDGAANRWGHWCASPTLMDANTVSVEMWPDMTEYPKSELVPVKELKHADGSQAYLYSSVRPGVVDLHFKWMRDYGIDGVFVQRFLCGCAEPNTTDTTGCLAYARNAANRYGRTFTLCYDLSGTPKEQIYDMLVADWKFLVDEMKVTSDKRYLHEGGKPVLEIWGFYPDRFSGSLANKIVNFFKNDPKYGAFLIGGGAWWWRTIDDPQWARAYRRFDVIQPWNVGHGVVREGVKMASTDLWAADQEDARKHGMMYMPTIYPGFAWDNLMRIYNQPDKAGRPLLRRGGDFFWEQFVIATKMKVDTIYIAMFDEVDEGTAIFKVTNDPPGPAHFVTLDGKPTDWYLRLAGAGTKMFRGKAPLREQIPAKP